MAKRSAGLLMYRRRGATLEVLLVHLGGPFWSKKDTWFVPKGELAAGESDLAGARREFREETGFAPPEAEAVALGEIRLKSGKTVVAFAVEGDCDPAALRSDTFDLEWPPRSGRRQAFPEVDRAAFFSLDEAAEKMSPAEAEFLERLRRAPL